MESRAQSVARGTAGLAVEIVLPFSNLRGQKQPRRSELRRYLCFAKLLELREFGH